MNKRQQLGQFLREARIKAGFSQVTVAKYIGLTSDSVIAHYESGLRVIPNKYLPEIADLLGLQLEILVQMKVRIEEEKIVNEVYERESKQ